MQNDRVSHERLLRMIADAEREGESDSLLSALTELQSLRAFAVPEAEPVGIMVPDSDGFLEPLWYEGSQVVEGDELYLSPAFPQTAAVAVKRLGPWRRGYCDEKVTIEQASFGGLYQVRILNGVVNLDWPDRNPPSVFDTAEEAKSAAQADYERRILSAIAQPAALQAAIEGE